MRDVYEAVIGDDIEACSWCSATTATGAVALVVEIFAHEVMEPDDTGDYTVTIYRDGATETIDGDDHIVGWADRGTCPVTFHSLTEWTIGAIQWDGVAIQCDGVALESRYLLPCTRETPPSPLVQAVAEARDLANRLAVSRGIAGTKGEAALLDVRDALAAALRGVSDV